MPYWEIAAISAGCLAVVALVLFPIHVRWVRVIDHFAREAAIVLALFALWQIVRGLAITRVAGGVSHGQAIWDLERTLHFPSEVSLQHLVLPHPDLVRWSNTFYATVHFPAMILCLLWVWVRHRDCFSRMRNVVVLFTGGSVLIQMIPVAPPRLLDHIGIVDTALLYNQSVYGAMGTGIADQLSALPSVHVGWSVLVAMVVIRASPSRWRWLIVLHPIVTTLVVALTGNHYWMDGVAAVGVILVALVVERLLAAGYLHLRAQIVPRSHGLAPPVPEAGAFRVPGWPYALPRPTAAPDPVPAADVPARAQPLSRTSPG